MGWNMTVGPGSEWDFKQMAAGRIMNFVFSNDAFVFQMMIFGFKMMNLADKAAGMTEGSFKLLTHQQQLWLARYQGEHLIGAPLGQFRIICFDLCFPAVHRVFWV